MDQVRQQEPQHWESLIASRRRPIVCQAIEDPAERNKKACQKRATKKWRENHKEHVKAKQKEWLDANPEKRALYREHNKKNVKAWAEKHKERIRELGRVNDARRRQSEKRKNWIKEYRQRPEVKEKLRERDRARAKTPERQAYERERAKRRWAEKKAKKLLEQQQKGIENENKESTKNTVPAEA